MKSQLKLLKITQRTNLNSVIWGIVLCPQFRTVLCRRWMPWICEKIKEHSESRRQDSSIWCIMSLMAKITNSCPFHPPHSIGIYDFLVWHPCLSCHVPWKVKLFQFNINKEWVKFRRLNISWFLNTWVKTYYTKIQFYVYV